MVGRNAGVAIIFLLITALVGCSSATSSNPGAGMGEGESGTGSAAKTITLRASIESPPEATFTKAFDAFLDEIENRSEGQIKFERFYSGTLAPVQDIVDALANGVADVASITPELQSGKLSLVTVGSNPALYQNTYAAIKTMNELYDSIPELNAELENAGVKRIGQWAAAPYYIISKKSIQSISDLKGMRVLATGRSQALLAENLGMTPVGLPFTESFEALSKGLLDGVFLNYIAAQTFGVAEAAKYVYELPVAGNTGIYGMSKQVWDELPESLKSIIQEVSDDFHPASYKQIYQEEGELKAVQFFKEQNAQIVQATEEDFAALTQVVAESVWPDWVEEQEAKGLPGKLVLDSFVQVSEKYANENTAN